MNRPAASLLLPLLLLALAGGCAHRSETFDVEVHNATNNPVTISLAKDGPPFESKWITPEDVTRGAPMTPEQIERGETGMGQVLPPGKTAYMDRLTGKFDPGVRGYVRVYNGQLTISQMLSKSFGSGDRLDIRLVPGPNRIVVTDTGHGLAAGPATQPAPRK